MYRAIVAVLAFSLALVQSNAADLPRRPSFGASLTANIPDATRSAQKLSAGEGLLIVAVLPGLSAEAAGMTAGDIVVALDGRKISVVADIITVTRAHSVGDTIPVGYVRNGARKTGSLLLKGLQFETAGDLDVVYDAVAVGAATRRVIITRPRGSGRFPAVLLVGGIGCYSFDAPLNDKDVYRSLLYALTRQGLVTMRVEKSGMGDSTGTPCSDVDLEIEASGYRAGLKMLKSLTYVDARRSFILGHSIGGVVGPMVAAKEPVRGLVVMETLGMTWFEYELINTRRQLKLGGASPIEIGAQLMLKEWCMHRLLIERTPRADILKAKPDCADHMEYPASDIYVQQAAAQNLPALWEKSKKADVAVIYGAADFVTGVDESKAVVDAVNAARAGGGTYIEIPDMDHYLVETANQAASLQRVQSGGAGGLHPRLASIIGDWLKAKAR
ncbi:MAG: alpha/beta fold hydrolase [Alphaproteobacteria bacterium]|nr:alpha/beta fold hydrolase [Alphaproteobacteria bacterium]